MHPIQFDVDTPQERNRTTVLIRLLLVIPHAVVLGLYGLVAAIVTIAQWFTILFTGNRNESIADLQRKYLWYAANVYGYMYLLHDHFPVFGPDDPATPVTFSVTPDGTPPNRLTNALRAIWIIPAGVIFYLLNIVNEVLAIVNWLMIVITGTAPDGTIDLVERIQRYSLRVTGYGLLLTDAYPKFE